MVCDEFMPEENKKWDLFICHASEDKEEIVRLLVNALMNAGYKVWYDEFELKLGDSLRKSIDRGLSQSKYGLVILSPHFFEKNWPQTELNGLAARERDGKKVILPVWHKVDESVVRRYSPTLADRVAARTSKGVDSVVKEVLKVLKPSNTRKENNLTKKSVRSQLETILDFIRQKDQEAIIQMVKDASFDDIKQLFRQVLDGIAFFDLPHWQVPAADESLFYFIETAILERNEKEGTELFENLLNWYFGTTTPSCKLRMLKMFAKLTKLSFIKKAISRSERVSSFVAEFGISRSYEAAGVNAQILVNLQSLLSDGDLEKIIDFTLANDQILYSYKARNYVQKILTSSKQVAKKKIDKLLEIWNQ